MLKYHRVVLFVTPYILAPVVEMVKLVDGSLQVPVRTGRT